MCIGTPSLSLFAYHAVGGPKKHDPHSPSTKYSLAAVVVLLARHPPAPRRSVGGAPSAGIATVTARQRASHPGRAILRTCTSQVDSTYTHAGVWGGARSWRVGYALVWLPRAPFRQTIPSRFPIYLKRPCTLLPPTCAERYGCVDWVERRAKTHSKVSTLFGCVPLSSR